jgi:HlyD family secretion protein
MTCLVWMLSRLTVKKLLVILVLVAVVLTVGAYWLNHTGSTGHSGDGYTFAAVTRGVMTETVSATGIIQPLDVLAIGSEIPGKVVSIYPGAEPNHDVSEGEALFKLDDRMARLKVEEAADAIRKAEADLERARAAQEAARLRVERLQAIPKDVGLTRELDEANMLLKSAEATVQAAQANREQATTARAQAQYGLELTEVRVPRRAGSVSGPTSPRRYTILERKVVAGQMVSPQLPNPLLTLASDLQHMQVHAQISENDIAKVRTGLKATFTVYAYSEQEKPFEGKITEIRPMPTNIHGAVFYDAVIDAENQRDARTGEWKLRPGMTASVDVIRRVDNDVWKVPTQALSFQMDDHFVTDAAREKLAQWQAREDHEDWKAVWILNPDNKPWPVFVRISARGAAGEAGIGDGQFTEALDWDPEIKDRLDAKHPETFPRLVTGTPPVGKRSLFDRPNVRIF